MSHAAFESRRTRFAAAVSAPPRRRPRPSWIGRLALAWLFAPLQAALAQIPCNYEVTAILAGPCGSDASMTPMAISPNGRYVAGYCATGPTKAFVYDVETGVLTMLPGPGESAAYDVNDNGLVVGGRNGGPFKIGFVYDLHTGQYIAEIPAAVTNGECYIIAINSSGKVCGMRSIGLSPPLKSAFTWSQEEGAIDLGLINGKNTNAWDINDNGAVAARYFVGAVQLGMIWKDGVVTPLESPTPFDSGAAAINNQGIAAGGWTVQPNPILGHPGIWVNGAATELFLPPDFVTGGPQDINNSGICVGRCKKAPNNAQFLGAIWAGDEVAVLNDLVDSDEFTYLGVARGISDAGRIVAEGHLASNFHVVAVVLTPVGVSPADIVIDCRVDVDDLFKVINEWGESRSVADINADGVVDAADLMMVIEQWTAR